MHITFYVCDCFCAKYDKMLLSTKHGETYYVLDWDAVEILYLDVDRGQQAQLAVFMLQWSPSRIKQNTSQTKQFSPAEEGKEFNRKKQQDTRNICNNSSNLSDIFINNIMRLVVKTSAKFEESFFSAARFSMINHKHQFRELSSLCGHQFHNLLSRLLASLYEPLLEIASEWSKLLGIFIL